MGCSVMGCSADQLCNCPLFKICSELLHADFNLICFLLARLFYVIQDSLHTPCLWATHFCQIFFALLNSLNGYSELGEGMMADKRVSEVSKCLLFLLFKDIFYLNATISISVKLP